MIRLDALKSLLAKTERELEEIRQCSHPFRREFTLAWEARVAAVKVYIAKEEAESNP
jgi:hypothetical protein